LSYAVRFEEVTKRYRRGGPRYSSLRHDLGEGLQRAAQVLRGRRTQSRGSLALERVSFEVPAGESFAVIGANGAGKTTALKIISRITYPTGGRALVRGRVGALIEVGSGVHPELTARENIWLYGQILGLTKADIRRRFDEIVEFSELSQVLDMPVKMYSIGMQMRLGFSIASHLEPEVFVVDEALAVGDAGFQAKCVERMTRLITEGRTLLFVSHNLYAVETLCPRGLLLHGGRVLEQGPIKSILGRYLNTVLSETVALDETVSVGSGPVQLRVRSLGSNGAARVRTGEELKIVCDYQCASSPLDVLFHFGVSDGRSGNLFLASQVVEGQGPVRLGRNGTLVCRIPGLPLLPRVYELWGEVRLAHGWGNLVDWQQLGRFVVDYDESTSGSISHAWIDAPLRVRSYFDHQ
jgi:lipopolysaccharide transport system ATP-binding protein